MPRIAHVFSSALSFHSRASRWTFSTPRTANTWAADGLDLGLHAGEVSDQRHGVGGRGAPRPESLLGQSPGEDLVPRERGVCRHQPEIAMTSEHT